jgi:hypothetical protein
MTICDSTPAGYVAFLGSVRCVVSVHWKGERDRWLDALSELREAGAFNCSIGFKLSITGDIEIDTLLQNGTTVEDVTAWQKHLQRVLDEASSKAQAA